MYSRDFDNFLPNSVDIEMIGGYRYNQKMTSQKVEKVETNA
jgi:hypothetical protein